MADFEKAVEWVVKELLNVWTESKMCDSQKLRKNYGKKV